MIIGTVKELKNHEYRVGITPDHVKGYVKDGHTVYVEKNAGKAWLQRRRGTDQIR